MTLKLFKAKKNNQKGQLSIFLGISLLVVVSLMAFIINVGMFVKAKINLQNAVDAGAWSGAAVQARQLSNMGHLNWELRNVYKEWMFKYYVLGHMGLTSLKPQNLAGTQKVNFRLQSFSGNVANTDYDRYNLPSVCIHFGSANNICKIYSIPGLPRFETNGLPSLSESTTSFLNAIVKDKAKNCSTRSDINFGAAMVWTYGMGKNLFTDMASVAAHRVGAWPRAFELGLRMRNLEAIANRPPVDGALCIDSANIPGCQQISNLDSRLVNYNERPHKAFMAAFRNLSGGSSKDNADQESNDHLVSTFTLTELAPSAFIPENNSLSSLLIPNGSPFKTKYYVDLQVYPLNLVNFYTHFVASSGDDPTIKKEAGGVPTEASCPGTKVAIPVPGYIFGFVKNPEVLTYYAVKGSAKFVGMFYPFADQEGIELTAFAASKPFGGRIGPRLFGISNSGSVIARADEQKRSAPYVSYIGGSRTFSIGEPIPTDNSFWATQRSDPIGGSPLAGNASSFVIPNLLYNYDDIGSINNQAGNAGGQMTEIRPAATKALSQSVDEELGLYSTKQYLALRSNLPVLDAANAAISAKQIDLAIESTKRPTNYEALNYLIPTFEENPAGNPDKFDALPVVNSTQNNPVTGTKYYYLFAPLVGEDTLYSSKETIKAIATEYLANSSSAIEIYIEALRKTAESVLNKGAQTTGGDFSSAANTIYQNAKAGGTHQTCPASNPSMAQKFYQLFRGTGTTCGITPLDNLIAEYVDQESSQSVDPNHGFSKYYVTTYFNPSSKTNSVASLTNSQLMTAYMPGTRQGVSKDGIFNHPFLNKKVKMKRNYYSTKFVSLKSISETGNGTFSKQPIYSEDVGSNAPATVEFKDPSDLTGNQIKNRLNPGQLSDYNAAKLSH